MKILIAVDVEGTDAQDAVQEVEGFLKRAAREHPEYIWAASLRVVSWTVGPPPANTPSIKGGTPS